MTGLFLWMVARNVSLSELIAVFESANYRLVAPAAAATLIGYFLRAVRWQRIVEPVAPLGFKTAFSVLMMGFASNNLLPARLGEFVRAYLLGQKIGVRKTYGMATIILERVCDGVTLILFLGAVSLLVPLPGWGREVQLFSSLLFLGAIGGIVLLLTQESIAVMILGVLLRPFPKQVATATIRASKTFILGLHSMRSRKGLGVIALVSLAVWLLEATSYLLMCRAFGVRMSPLSQLLSAVFLLVVVNLGIMLPSAPGYVGTFQFFAVWALGAFDVSKENALAVGIASHLMQYLMVTAIGLVFFARENLAFWRFQKETAEEAAEEEIAMPVEVS